MMHKTTKRKQQTDNTKQQTFSEKVYDLVRKIPKGKISTYKDIAIKLNTTAYRAVGQALRSNPYAPKVPCHRVVAKNGNIGGFMGDTNGASITKKIKMLGSEGVQLKNNAVVDFDSKRHRF